MKSFRFLKPNRPVFGTANSQGKGRLRLFLISLEIEQGPIGGQTCQDGGEESGKQSTKYRSGTRGCRN